MTPLTRTLGLLLVILTSPARGEGQPVVADTAPLEFHGFRAGARLDELQAMVRRGMEQRLLAIRRAPRKRR